MRRKSREGRMDGVGGRKEGGEGEWVEGERIEKGENDGESGRKGGSRGYRRRR